MNIPFSSIILTTFLLTQVLFTAVKAEQQIKKTSNLNISTPSPTRFVVKEGSIQDLTKKKTAFFKGIGYSPYLPGETPLKGASPGNDERYREHLTLMQ